MKASFSQSEEAFSRSHITIFLYNVYTFVMFVLNKIEILDATIVCFYETNQSFQSL